MMVPRKSGLIVNISSIGGQIYLFNVPYGAGKAAMDKMAHDCAQELKEHNVTMVALWPGAVRTEKVTDIILGETLTCILLYNEMILIVWSPQKVMSHLI